MSSVSYEESKKTALRLIIFLAIITIVEVFISLLGKGHISEGIRFSDTIIRGLMIIFSLVKAFYIVGEFMHLKYEVGGFGKTVILPMSLLIWGVIAFTADGDSWLANKNEMSTESMEYDYHKPISEHGHDTHTKEHDTHKKDDDHGHDHDNHDGHSH